MTHTETPVKMAKIISSGRSGSTILDVVLGKHPRIESVGEVGNLMRNGWISKASLRGIDSKRLRVPICTCGKRLDVLYVDTPDEARPFCGLSAGAGHARQATESLLSLDKARIADSGTMWRR